MASSLANGESLGEQLSSSDSETDRAPTDLASEATARDQDDGFSHVGAMHEPQLASEETLDTLGPFESNGTTPEHILTVERHEVEDVAKRCLCCRVCCFRCCKPCMTKHNPLPPSPSRGKRVKYACMCPPHGKLGRWMTLVLSVVLFWATLWSITGAEALPGGNYFSILVLLVAAVLGGILVSLIKLPPLLGMLLVGCLLRNVPHISVAKDIDPEWSSALRNIALVVILIRAGLGLDPAALRKLSGGVLRLAFLPCLFEAVTAAVASNLIMGFPWVWGFMLGFVLAAVSPAVVVPSMLSLQDRGYGVAQGIPTLVIAAASVDDVLAISGFGVVLGIAFSTGGLALAIVKGPLEAVAGIIYGVLLGVIAWYLPPMKHRERTLYQFLIVVCGGLFATFGSRVADLAGAGALGCLTLAFVAALGWRKGLPEDAELPLSPVMGKLWDIFQPLLFGLIGAEIDITTIQPTTIGLATAVLFIGLAVRVVVSFLSVFRLGFTLREKLFIPLAWLPKATVQAAIGSVALDTARAKNADQDQIDLGLQLLTIAVLVIIITAPLGAIAISLSAPRLLQKNNPKKDQNNTEEVANEVTQFI